MGTRCRVKTNHFFVRLDDKKLLHQYQVEIEPEPTQRSVRREVLSKLVSERQQTGLSGHLLSTTARVTCTLGVRIRWTTMCSRLPWSTAVADLSLEELWMFLSGSSSDIPGHELQILGTVLHDIVLNQRHMGYIAVRQSFFPQHIGRNLDLGSGIAGRMGFYRSIRATQNGLSLIVDISSTAFIQPLPLIEFAMTVLKKGDLRQISEDDYKKLERALMGVKVEVTHRDERRKFVSSSGDKMTVKSYFRKKYEKQLEYGFLRCVRIGREENHNYIPLEVCKILPRQQYQKKLAEGQISNLMRSTCLKPSDREESIRQVVERNQYSETARTNEFGLEVDSNPTMVGARVLPAPTLKYHDDKECQPRNGKWNMQGKKVYEGAIVNNWVCINFCQDLLEDDVRKFCKELARQCRGTGLDFPDGEPPIFGAISASDLHKWYQNSAKTKRGAQKIDLLLAILPDINGKLYGDIKRICETDLGLMSQCCRKDNVLNKHAYYVANVAIKINAKVGGKNSVFYDIEASLPIVSKKPTIIFGADVTHPAAFDDSSPSIACVVASREWPEVVRYNGVVHAQGHRKETIDGLDDIIMELLRSVQTEPDMRPQQLIFYRDGVGESQFQEVLKKEIPDIEKAWKLMYNDQKPPQITFIVVQKRHHTRLFPENYNDQLCKENKGNVLPGTVVDEKICHPREFDFFLCIHAAGTQGTSRPVHYHVLRDDNNFTADQLQSLTNSLCYTYAFCTRSVSIDFSCSVRPQDGIPCPVLPQGSSNVATATSSSSVAAPAVGGSEPLLAIKDELKGSMFYC
ncbi:hypothetical protein ACP4OV_006667 [Aristida adscensionis]